MENSLFSKLLSLHTSPVPIEKFTTEVLAGVLRSNQVLLDKFVNTVLNIKGNGFKVETQKNYQNIQPDMVFSNTNSLCFLKNKVDYFEGYKQLEKHKMVLEEQPHTLNVYLRYCTQYYEQKDIEDINFEQLFWSDIYSFLEQSYSENPLVEAFLYFLRENNMNQVAELNADDVVAMSHLDNTLKKMDLCLDSVTAEFSELFGYPNIGAPKQHKERLRDLGLFKQYHITKEPILHGGGGEWGWSDIRISFAYNEEPTQLMVWYWCGRTHSQYNSLKKMAKKHQRWFSNYSGFLLEDTPNWLVIAIKKPLADFESEAKPLQAIQNWLIDTLRVFRKFADKTPELHWNIPK